MLNSLHIENYALIQQYDVDLQDGMVVITGETGAGKSILLGALGLLLGQRSDSGVLHDKNKKCIVEATFDVAKQGLQSFFDAHDLDYDDQLILRREILPSAKSRAFVNDSPVSLAVIKELSQQLIDIHSQHQTLTLAEASFQIDLLDTFLGGKEARKAYADAYSVYQEAKRHLERLSTEDAQNRKEQDYMQFLFDELQDADLQSGEQEDLEQESKLMANAESIKETLCRIQDLCEESEGSAISRLRQSLSLLNGISPFSEELDAFSHRLESNIIDLRDLFSDLERVNDNVNFSAERLQTIDDRLDKIYSLQRKHSVSSIDDLLAIQNELDQKLQNIAGMDEAIRSAMEQVDKSFTIVRKTAEKLTAIRKKSAVWITQEVMPMLASLGMKEARIQIEVTPTEDYHPWGCDKVQFLFNANRGGELRELGKVVSGGELSRLMLALKALMAREAALPTIIFDEIDTGISGEVAAKMAHILQDMAQTMQVISITHLPQMAAAAQQHLMVCKQVKGDATVSVIRELIPEERIKEIAIMLSTNPPTEAALQTARELMMK